MNYASRNLTRKSVRRTLEMSRSDLKETPKKAGFMVWYRTVMVDSDSKNSNYKKKLRVVGNGQCFEFSL